MSNVRVVFEDPGQNAMACYDLVDSPIDDQPVGVAVHHNGGVLRMNAANMRRLADWLSARADEIEAAKKPGKPDTKPG